MDFKPLVTLLAVVNPLAIVPNLRVSTGADKVMRLAAQRRLVARITV